MTSASGCLTWAGLPVRARPDTIGYRAQKFIGRHRFASALAALTVVFLVTGVAVSMWQASVARRRFNDLRQLAHAVVFDVNDTLSAIPGTTAARKLLVETALQYLDRLGRDNLSDPQLREELAAAYLRIGEVQGGAFPTEAHSFGSGPKAELTGNRPVVATLPPGYGPANEE